MRAPLQCDTQPGGLACTTSWLWDSFNKATKSAQDLYCSHKVGVQAVRGWACLQAHQVLAAQAAPAAAAAAEAQQCAAAAATRRAAAQRVAAAAIRRAAVPAGQPARSAPQAQCAAAPSADRGMWGAATKGRRSARAPRQPPVAPGASTPAQLQLCADSASAQEAARAAVLEAWPARFSCANKHVFNDARGPCEAMLDAMWVAGGCEVPSEEAAEGQAFLPDFQAWKAAAEAAAAAQRAAHLAYWWARDEAALLAAALAAEGAAAAAARGAAVDLPANPLPGGLGAELPAGGWGVRGPPAACRSCCRVHLHRVQFLQVASPPLRTPAAVMPVVFSGGHLLRAAAVLQIARHMLADSLCLSMREQPVPASCLSPGCCIVMAPAVFEITVVHAAGALTSRRLVTWACHDGSPWQAQASKYLHARGTLKAQFASAQVLAHINRQFPASSFLYLNCPTCPSCINPCVRPRGEGQASPTWPAFCWPCPSIFV